MPFPKHAGSEQSVFPLQSLSKSSAQFDSVAVLVASKTPGELSHKLSPHSLSFESPSKLVPVFVHVHDGQVWYLLPDVHCVEPVVHVPVLEHPLYWQLLWHVFNWQLGHPVVLVWPGLQGPSPVHVVELQAGHNPFDWHALDWEPQFPQA